MPLFTIRSTTEDEEDLANQQQQQQRKTPSSSAAAKTDAQQAEHAEHADSPLVKSGEESAGGTATAQERQGAPPPFLLFTGQDADAKSAERNRSLGAARPPARAGSGATTTAPHHHHCSSSSSSKSQFESRPAAAAAAEPSPANVFREFESPTQQMQRLKALQESNPRYVQELLHRGEVLNLLAEHGNLREIQGAVRGFKRGDLLSWFVVRVFRTCMRKGHVSILKYMTESGFDVRHVGIQTLLHEYAEGKSGDEGDGEGEGSGESAWNLAACDFLIRAGFDVDNARRGDYRTPLHQACEYSKLELVQLFLHHGADVNAVAKGGVTPLKLAMAAAAADPRDFKDSKKILLLLQTKGAKQSWRRTEAPAASAVVASASHGRAEAPEMVTMSFNLTHDNNEGDIVVEHPARARARREAEQNLSTGAAPVRACDESDYTTTSFNLTGEDDDADIVVEHPGKARAAAAAAAAAAQRQSDTKLPPVEHLDSGDSPWSWEQRPELSSENMPLVRPRVEYSRSLLCICSLSGTSFHMFLGCFCLACLRRRRMSRRQFRCVGNRANAGLCAERVLFSFPSFPRAFRSRLAGCFRGNV